MLEYILQLAWTWHIWLTLLVVYLLWKNRNSKLPKYNLPPRPYSYPLIGNTIAFFRNRNNFFRWCKEVADQHGPVFRLNFGLAEFVVVNDYESAQKALVDTGIHLTGRSPGPMFNAFSDGYKDILMTDGNDPAWKARRKLLACAVKNFTIGYSFEHRVEKALDALMHHIDVFATNNKAVDPTDYCKYFTHAHMWDMCFQKNLDINDPEFQKVSNAIQEGMFTFSKVVNYSHIPYTDWLPFELPDIKSVKKMKNALIDLMKREMCSTQRGNEENHEENHMNDLLSYILYITSDNANEGLEHLKPIEILHALVDVYLPGVDTTQMSIRWLLVILALHPHIQEQILHEINDVVPKDIVFVSEKDYRHNMPYSNAVVLETTRFRPVVTLLFAHTALQDTNIGQYDIPQHMQVYINQWAVNHDDKEFHKPEKFIPERFLTEDGRVGPRPRGYMPFGAGRRSCPGEAQGKSTIWLTMIALVRKYKILPADEEEIILEYDLTNYDGSPTRYKVRFEKR